MFRNMIATASSVGLYLASVTPLAAQEVRDDIPRGATATLNLRVPLGRQNARPSWGLTAFYGQTAGAPGSDGRIAVREWRVADLRFDGGGLRRAELATFDLANLRGDRRLGFQDEGDSGDDRTLNYILIALLAAAAGVGAEMLIDDNDDEDETEETPGATSPGIG